MNAYSYFNKSALEFRKRKQFRFPWMTCLADYPGNRH